MQHNDARFLELLQRWQSGDFTRADEQELNSLAASDDFRREALEGFMSLPETAHNERLAALRIRLKKRVGGGRRVALPQILAAAAALILLLAAIFFFPKSDEEEVAPVAQTQVESAGQNPPPAPVLETETPENERIAANLPPAKPVSPAVESQPFSGAGSSLATDQPAAFSEEAPALADDDAQPAAPAASRALENASGAPEREFSKAKKAEEVARPAAADSVWHETDRKPDMDAEKKAAKDALQKQESEPLGGWESFSEYLRQNARLPAEARNRNVSGTVRIQFNINENGEPQGFMVLRSLGYGCDQEAIRLVQNWEWTRGQNPAVTVDVPFVR